MLSSLRILLLFGVVFLGKLTVAQKVLLIGNIKDKTTKEAVPYAHLIFTEARLGTTSNGKGKYYLNIDKKLLAQQIRISCIGYETKEITAGTLANNTIFLQPSVESLDEVVVEGTDFESKKKHKTLNPFKRKQKIGLGNFSGGAYPSVLARYYENDFQTSRPVYIDEVTVYLERHYRGSSKFKLRILSATDSLSPGKDLLHRNLIVDAYPHDRKVKVDLSIYRIKIPKKGFFVAVEHLFIPHNMFEEKIDVKINDSIYKDVSTIRYGPVFSGIEEKREASNSFYRSNTGWKSMQELKIPEYGGAFKNGKIASPAFKVKVVY